MFCGRQYDQQNKKDGKDEEEEYKENEEKQGKQRTGDQGGHAIEVKEARTLFEVTEVLSEECAKEYSTHLKNLSKNDRRSLRK